MAGSGGQTPRVIPSETLWPTAPVQAGCLAVPGGRGRLKPVGATSLGASA